MFRRGDPDFMLLLLFFIHDLLLDPPRSLASHYLGNVSINTRTFLLIASKARRYQITPMVTAAFADWFDMVQS